MKTVVLACLLAVVAACARPGSGPASGVAGAGVSVGPCQEDAARFCPGQQMAGGRLPACLRQAAWNLSPACSEYLPTLEKQYWAERDAR